ncbi:MAG: ATP-binding protein [Candidatus Bathyarchaeota archaeon]|nr:MAG: ATP-binding protein [Candidatus Bathyarchaeota archaeon]
MKEPFASFIETELAPNTLLIMCGLPGTWKTETAQEIAKIKGYPILRSDLIRLDVFKKSDVFDEKIAANMNKRELVYKEMFRQTTDLVKVHGGVILDATFVTQKLRRQAAAIAAQHGLILVILQTQCSEEVSITRILRRTKENYESNALTRQAYLNNKRMFEPVDLEDLKKKHPQLELLHLIVDTEFDQPEDWWMIGRKIR